MKILRLFLLCVFGCLATVIWAQKYTLTKKIWTTSDDDIIPRTQNDERIMRFHADIKIDTTGRVEVTEHIRIYALGQTFKRGITRNIPQMRKDRFGKFHFLPIKVLGATHNGRDETYHTENKDDDIFIRIGQSNVYIDHGPNDYTITYESYGQIGLFDDYDELYWNVTGNDTEVTTDEASATVTLPIGIKGIRAACYTGFEGSTAQNCTFNSRENVYTFQSSQALQPYEGLTVAVAFPKGAIHQHKMTRKESILYYWQRYRDVVAPIGITLACFIYLFISWFRKGRNAYKPTVIPQFRPPRGYSPAVISSLCFKECDSRAFAAELVNMAVHGGAKIVPEDDGNGTTYTFFAGKTDNLNKEDQLIYNCLFNEKLRSVKYPDNDYKDTFLSAYKALYKKVLAKSVVKKNLRNMTVNNTAGCTIPFIAIGLMVALGSSFWVAFVCLIALFYARKIYSKAMPQLSKHGADLKAEVDGFHLYMKTAEEDRLNGMMGAPERTPELFEELLPYAIALNLENEWCDRFKDVLSRIEYNPEWYVTPGSFTSAAMFSTLATDMNTYATQTESDYDAQHSSSGSYGSSDWSSGSSGGGSSGGGGGGGGTGGW